MSEMRVELGDELIGHLVVDADGSFDFRADPAAIRSHGVNSKVLSLAIPLLPRPRATNVDLRRNFFDELLPEGGARTQLALEARVQESDTAGMLREYGRDVAGAVQIWDPELPDEPRVPGLEPVDEDEIAEMFAAIPLRPLGNVPRRGKTSLAGLQSKIVLVQTDNGWARAIDGYPSTHIVKPVVGVAPSRIFDEEYGSRFARGLGLAAFDTSLRQFGGQTALVIERYDRAVEAPRGRLHQEDFNQVLGLAGAKKYEMYGGLGFRHVAAHLNDVDKITLAKMMTVSVALGNLDLHMKNLSLLHHSDGTTELAPMYDLVPQTHDPNVDGEMALYVDGVREHRLLTVTHLINEVNAWGVENSELVISSALEVVEEIARTESPHVAAYTGLQAAVLGFARALLDGGEVGGPAPRVRRTGGGWGWDNVAPEAPKGRSRTDHVER